jgi:hypothetical protein
LQDRAGQALGSMREAAGQNTIDPVFDSLEAARQRATSGMRGGAWDAVHRKFDEAQETLMGLLNDGPEVALSKVEQAKKLLSNTVNWIADNVSQDTAKKISGAIESGVESIMRSKGIDMAEYAAQKGLYGASKTMQKGLANEVAAQAGNNAVSLPTMVAGAGQLATGNPVGAAATLGIIEALRRRGAGVGARAVEGVDSVTRLLRRPIDRRIGSQAVGLGQGLASSTERYGPRLFDAGHEPSGGPLERGGNGFKSLFKKPKTTMENGGGNDNRHLNQPNNNGNKENYQNNNAGNVERRGNQGTPKKILGTRVAKVLTDAEAKKYLKKAGNDPEKARRLARLDGWTIPQ